MEIIEFLQSHISNGGVLAVVYKDSGGQYNIDKSKSFEGSGIRPLLQAIENNKEIFVDSVCGDKVVGRAAAYLFEYAKIKKIYTATVSKGALEVFENAKIECIYDSLVDYIVNRDKTGQCPMEKICTEIYDCDTAYKVLKEKVFAK